MLKTSPFHPRTAALVRAQTWRRWAGYQMASSYDPLPDREYAAIRSAAALLDVSPLYKYRITGRDAMRLLDRMVTRDLTKLVIGQVYYTPWCDAAGKVIVSADKVVDGKPVNMGKISFDYGQQKQVLDAEDGPRNWHFQIDGHAMHGTLMVSGTLFRKVELTKD